MDLTIATLILLAIGQSLVWWKGTKRGDVVWRAGMFVTIVATILCLLLVVFD